jgi:hypothetical protein
MPIELVMPLRVAATEMLAFDQNISMGAMDCTDELGDDGHQRSR